MGLSSFTDAECLVSGAASGIGRATALALAARGAVVHLTDIDAAGMEETAAEIVAAGRTVGIARAVDLRDHASVLALADEVHSSHGSLDAVMNVAGVSTWGPIERLEHSDWTQMIEIDLVGPISVLEAFVPAMIEAGRVGHVVNVSSAASTAKPSLLRKALWSIVNCIGGNGGPIW